MYNSGMHNQAPTPEKIVSWRQDRRKKVRAGFIAKLKKFGIGVLAVFSLLLLAAIGTAAYTYSLVTADLPAIEALPELLGPRGQLRHATRLYDRSGENLLVTLENPNAAQAEYLFLELIPEDVVNATLVMRDPAFWEHNGYLINAEKPTLAEQLVSDLLLFQQTEGWKKTWQTRLLAAQATEQYGREQILEWYLNNAAYGELAFGVDEAAWVYFNKSAEELNLAEAATLGAVVDAPALNPINAEQVAIERQGKTLNAMLAAGMVTANQAMAANSQAIPIQGSALPVNMIAPDFTTLALADLYQFVGREQAERGGFEVMTSVDLALQTQTDCTLGVQLARLEGRLPLNSLGGVNCQSATLLPTLGQNYTSSGAEYQAGAVILSAESGELLAASGLATASHQAGTILSPYIYLTAFTRGLSPASLVWDIPASTPPGLEAVANFDNTYHGPMRIRTASVHDYLIPLLSTLRQVGPTNAWRTVQQSGITSLVIPNENEYSPLLEDDNYTLLEITHGYSLFANQGSLAGLPDQAQGNIQPITLLKITDTAGKVWLDAEPQTTPVTTPQLAYLITDMLADEQARSESLGHPNPYEIGRPAAANWGRAILNGDVWSVGYTPDRVTGIWLGQAEPQTAAEETIAQTAAAGIWHALMKTAHTDLPITTFDQPVGITTKIVCDPSGLLPTSECPDTVSEIFIIGNEPVQTDNLYQTFQINSQTNRLATIYTPTEFLQERVYLVVPPEAETWALQSGMEIPPDTYDVVFNPSTSNADASILTPEIFGYVSGEVTISGNAAGDDFAAYRVQVGSGLNPQQWLQIGETATTPVSSGTLASWDTTGLSGLYAIQLQVIDEENAIQTASIQVTVDNEAPVIQVLQPAEEQVFDVTEERSLTLQAQVTDNVSVQRIEFWMDGRLLTSLTNTPYATPWTATPGSHELEVRAVDLAGNISVALVPFEVE